MKEIHHIHEHNETIDKVVSEFHVRLVVEKRSEQNPSGLLVGEYWERAIEGEKRDWVLQQAGLNSSDQSIEAGVANGNQTSNYHGRRTSGKLDDGAATRAAEDGTDGDRSFVISCRNLARPQPSRSWARKSRVRAKH